MEEPATLEMVCCFLPYCALLFGLGIFAGWHIGWIKGVDEAQGWERNR